MFDGERGRQSAIALLMGKAHGNDDLLTSGREHSLLREAHLCLAGHERDCSGPSRLGPLQVLTRAFSLRESRTLQAAQGNACKAQLSGLAAVKLAKALKGGLSATPLFTTPHVLFPLSSSK